MNYYEPGTPFVKRLDARRPPAHSCAPRPRACAAPRDGRDFPEKSLCRRKVLPSRFYRVHFSAKSFFSAPKGCGGWSRQRIRARRGRGRLHASEEFPPKTLFQKLSPTSFTLFAEKFYTSRQRVFFRLRKGVADGPACASVRAAAEGGSTRRKSFPLKLSSKSFRQTVLRSSPKSFPLFGKESEGARRVAPPAHPCAPRPRAAPRVGRVFGQKLSAKSFRANSFRVL